MKLDGIEGNGEADRVLKFVPSEEHGVFVFEDPLVMSRTYNPSFASSISIIGVDRAIAERFADGDESVIATFEYDCVQPVDGEEGVYRVTDSGLTTKAVTFQDKIVMGFGTFRELVPIEAGVDLPAQPLRSQ